MMKVLPRARRALGTALAACELAVSAAAAAACWWGASACARRVSDAWAAAGAPPLTVEGALALAGDPVLAQRLWLWGTAAVLAAVGAALAVSAAHGTWWTARRLTRAL